MDNQDFINQLTSGLQPVLSVRPPLRNLVIVLIFSFLWLGFGVTFIGFRPDINETMKEASFWSSNVHILILAIASTFSSLTLSIPDRKRLHVFLTPAFTALLWILYLVIAALQKKHDLSLEGILCVRDILLFSIVPTILLVRMISKGSILQKGMTGIFSLLGGTALGALGTQFTCQDDPGLHVIVWHLLPIVILVFVGFILGKSVFDRKAL